MKNKLILLVFLSNLIAGFFSNLLASEDKDKSSEDIQSIMSLSSLSLTDDGEKNSPLGRGTSYTPTTSPTPSPYTGRGTSYTPTTSPTPSIEQGTLSTSAASLSGGRGGVVTPERLILNAPKTFPNSAPPKLLSLQPQRDSTIQPKKLNFQDQNIDGEPLEKIALFRGIHYVTNLFNSDAITQNIEDNDVDKFLVSSAACKLTGITFLSGTPGQGELLAGELIFKIMYQFKIEFEDLYHSFHETYTNDHIAFHDCLKNPNIGKDSVTRTAFTKYREIFEKYTKESYPHTWIEAVQRNPFVSFACQATHALKYGMGQKSFTGGDAVKLRPNYDQNGIPGNKYLGKLYIAILSPDDIQNLNPTFVIDKHAKNKVTIYTHNQNNILSENEVSFFGYLPVGLIKYSAALEIPNFTLGTKNNYITINSNFSKATGKASEIIKSSTLTFEEEANKLIRNLGCSRRYPNVFENDYTDNPEDSEKIRVARWLHSINEGKPVITSSPMKAIGSATGVSIEILTQCLQLQPTNHLSVISMSFCNLRDSGASFGQILTNNTVPLKELSLRNCQLTQTDAQHIAEGLFNNRCLINLILDSNNIGQQASKFAEVLKENRTLIHLSLYRTNIMDIQCFSGLFPKGGHKKSLNKTLRILNLDFDFNQQLLNTIQKGLYRNWGGE